MNAAESTDDAEGAGDPAVEQLQRAAQQMVDASRVALDALEAVISDRQRLGEIVTSFTDLLDRVGRTFSEFRPDASDVASTEARSDVREASEAGEATKARRVRRIDLDE